MGYAFPQSELKRYCSYSSAGEAGFASIDTDGSATFTSLDGRTERAVINVDSDPLYDPFVRQVARTLGEGFRGLPTLGELEDVMRIIWRAYDAIEKGYTMTDLNIDAVAKAAGVHRSTVSRAFSRPEAVKRETREHILRVAEELGYTMSPLAQALRTKTSTFVPLIVPDITNPFFAELAKTMTQAAGERGYQLVLCVTNGDNDADRRLPDRHAGAVRAVRHHRAVHAGRPRHAERSSASGIGWSSSTGWTSTRPCRASPSTTAAASSSPSTICARSATAGSATSRASRARTPPKSAWTRTASWPSGDPIVLDSGADTEAGERAAARVRRHDRPADGDHRGATTWSRSG